MTVNGIHSCSNRISSFTIHADTPEGFNRKQRIAVESIRVISTDENDMMRHDLLPDLF